MLYSIESVRKDIQLGRLRGPVPVEVLRNELARTTGRQLTRCAQYNRTPFLLRLQEVIYGHLIEHFDVDGLTGLVVDDCGEGPQTTINSAFFFSSSSKNSFSPRLSRTSTI
jgi:hypothetical protein